MWIYEQLTGRMLIPLDLGVTQSKSVRSFYQ